MSVTEKELENSVAKLPEESIEKPVEGLSKEQTEKLEEKTIEKPTECSTEKSEEEAIEKPTECSTEKSEEVTIEKLTEKSIKKYKKFFISAIIILCSLLGIYLGMAQYFVKHFYFGTKVNAINVSGKTVESVEAVMAIELQNYTINLKERGGLVEQIKADDIGLKYISDVEFKKLKASQNRFLWILECFNKENSEMTVGFTYDEELLKEPIDQLSCFDCSNIVEPKNPGFLYVDNNYVIVDGVAGNKVNKDILYSRVVDSILNKKTEVDLEAEGCYVKAQYDAESQKVIEARDILNKYVSSKITYVFGDNKEIIDSSKINQCLKVDDNIEVVIDEEKLKDYVDVLFDTYNTVGKTRNFITSSGQTIKIGGGDYGWSINKAEETQNLISAIKEGITMTKEPAYDQTAFSRGRHDIGNTYVEIDIARQHIWFYKNGSLIVQGNVVTGNVRNNHSTRKGIFRLKYKARNVVLKGADYAVHVDFWMPFDGGIGIHDASWRSSFGGNIYKTSGSHGCVNSPYNVAKEIFYNITPDTPVICY